MSELNANEEKKNMPIATSFGVYDRYAVKTHFIKEGENFSEIFEKYVLPGCKEGDIVSCSEKIVALCQGNVVRREDIKISGIANFLSKFASHPDSGIGVGEPIKMQFAIDRVGLPKVLYASVASAVTKLFGKKGVFYEIVGQDVSGLDGFYDHVWAEYRDIGILLPEDPAGACNKIKSQFGVSMMIVDANDFGQVILGKSSDISLSDESLVEMISDNPAGQEKQLTPFIIIRKHSEE